MDIELMENLTDSEVDELYADVLDGENQLIANRDDGKMWFCNATIHSPNGVIHQRYVQNIYKIIGYMIMYNRKSKELMNEAVFKNIMDYFYPPIGAAKENHSYIIPDTSTTTSASCFDLEECFWEMYENHFSFVEVCNKPNADLPYISIGGDENPKPSSSGSHQTIYMSGTIPKVDHIASFMTGPYHPLQRYGALYSTSRKWSYQKTITEEHYCGVEEFEPFYRNEQINNMNFDAYMLVSEYILTQTTNEIHVYTQDAVTSNVYIHSWQYILRQEDSIGRMHIHMECFR